VIVIGRRQNKKTLATKLSIEKEVVEKTIDSNIKKT
jgi:hypothetical protein